MNDFVNRLTSRKFLLAVAGLITCIATGNVPGAVACVLGYLGVEGATDFKNAGK